MKKLLIINKSQFGYETDTYKYCQYLRNDYQITYYCFDSGHQKIELTGVNIIYIASHGNYLTKAVRFFRSLYPLMARTNFSAVFIVNFDFCFIPTFFSRKTKYILDIRTGSVTPSKRKRFFKNFKTKINTLFFKNITIISEGLARKYKIQNFKVLPLGSDYMVMEPKSYSKLKLLYVGTFVNRNIYQTIEGLRLFIDEQGVDQSEIIYDIVGFGSPDDVNSIENTIKKAKLERVVRFHGRKNINELPQFLNYSNIGVCYVPVKAYYNFQPPTKTFEYIHSGLVCIATNTFENAKLINNDNGVLCESNSASFAKALGLVYQTRSQYNSTTIHNSLKSFTWFNISNNILSPYLNKVIND